ncbi:MAG: enolase [Thaumarchaeota archaeon]|nr:MAG: enolase [Nitrososphaerota archaeon]
MRVEALSARVAFNGRGDPGIEAEVSAGSEVGRALSPSGASRGIHEAVPFCPGGPDETARLVSSYKRRVVGEDATDILGLASTIKKIDGTPNYSRIGGSAAYSISVAAAVAASRARGVLLCRLIDPRCNTLPYPLGNVIGGGKHAGEKSPSIQEVLVAPLGATSMREAIQLNFDVHSRVGRELSSMLPYPVGRGDEGGWCPGLTDEDAIQLASEAAREVADRSGRKIRVGVDFAAGSLYNPKDGRYRYRASGKSVDREGQLSYVAELCDRFDLFYVEDPLQEEDFDGFADLTSSLRKTLVVGDDLYTTNLERLKEGARRKSTSGVIVKVNQVGTLGEAEEFSSSSKRGGQTLIASHRSGDNEDPHLADIAIGFGCALIKCGIIGAERTAKLNALLMRAEKLVRARMAKVG